MPSCGQTIENYQKDCRHFNKAAEEVSSRIYLATIIMKKSFTNGQVLQYSF